ncbi:MAG: hypothetical protein JOS17DRAFT_575997 [Linnemannia elongata]|nr:MAG: hypothetical protein JOS17DRAFT_575997 [Linnemannia elongata]
MAMYLDYYEQTFEAAKGFDDDFDFCPSLSPSELREIQRTRGTPTASPSGWRHQHQHHHHHHNHSQDKRRLPSSSLSYASYTYSSSCSSSSSGASSPSLSSSPLASPPLTPAPTTSRAIAIVDPISRTPVQLPGAAGTSSGTVTALSSESSNTTPSATTVIGGYFSGSNSSVLSLPPPLMFHEPALATLDFSSSEASEASEASMHFSPSSSSSPNSSTSEDNMMEGTQQFWMDFPPSLTTAQYFPYPSHPQDPMNAFSSYAAPAPYPVHHYPGVMGGGGGPAGFVAVPMMMMGF